MKRKRMSCVVLAFIECIIMFASAVAHAQSGNIHMLFVWGTKEPSTRKHVFYSKNLIERSFESPALDLSPTSDQVATYETLEGSDATPENIISAIERISRRAGSNDAVFVYMLCHGICIDENGGKTHVLLPSCDSISDPDISNDSIRRSAIMRAIKTSSHRLDMLVTDACSVTPELKTRPFPLAPPVFELSFLKALLLRGHGTININSTDPYSNEGEGEKSMSWIPANDVTTHIGGTVFTQAFLNVAQVRISRSDMASVTVDTFYGTLKGHLKRCYSNTLKFLKKRGDPAVREFAKQDTQTLTAFMSNGQPDRGYNSREFTGIDPDKVFSVNLSAMSDSSDDDDGDEDWSDDSNDDSWDTSSEQTARWSEPIYRPGLGDRIIEIEEVEVEDEAMFRVLIRDAPNTIILKVVDVKTGQTYKLKTRLNSPQAQSRFGLYVESDHRGGVRATGYLEGYPCTRCQLDLATYTVNPNGSGSGSGNGSSRMTLEPGDLIVSVNGTKVRSLTHFLSMVKSSPSTMRFNVVDTNSGGVIALRTRLNSSGQRMGVIVSETGEGPVMVSQVTPGSPATRCYVGH